MLIILIIHHRKVFLSREPPLFRTRSTLNRHTKKMAASAGSWDLEAREVIIVEKIDIIFLRHDGILALTNQRVLFQASHATDRTVSLPLCKIKGSSAAAAAAAAAARIVFCGICALADFT